MQRVRAARVAAARSALSGEASRLLNEALASREQRREHSKQRVNSAQRCASGHCLAPAAMANLVISITRDFRADGKYAPDALECVHEVAEAYLTNVFEMAARKAKAAKRSVVWPEDMKGISLRDIR